MSETQLAHYRAQIDDIDAQILSLLNQRAQNARTIGEIKGSGVIYRPEREAQVLRRIQSLNTGPLSDESVALLFREVMSACLSLEKPLSIAFLGPEGTFSHAAAMKHFGHAAQTIPCASIDEAFRAVEAGHCDYVVAPVENSTEGAVGRTLDLLTTTPLKICGEVVLRIHHHFLMQKENCPPEKIVSHAQSLAQCHEWLNRHYPDVPREAVVSNAFAAKLAAENPKIAAIAGQIAAERYGLSTMAQNIEDEPNNTTRFLVLGHQNTSASGQDKTSLICAAQNRAGAVHALLQPFANRGVSMSKFESRPAHTGLWEYVFFIDIEGHPDDAHVAQALEELRAVAGFVKIVGAYPVAVI